MLAPVRQLTSPLGLPVAGAQLSLDTSLRPPPTSKPHMGIAKDFNKIIHKELKVHAAWLPVTNTFEVGDFGMISDGVLQRMGNIRTVFGVDFQTREGGSATLDFKSERVREVKINAGAEVSAFPSGDGADAKLRISFERAKSFYLKAHLSVEEMESPLLVALALAGQPGWNSKKFTIVGATYSAPSCLVLSSKTGNTVVEIGGSAEALQALDGASVDVGLAYSSSSDLGLEVKAGTPGVVALNLFRAKKGEVDFFSAAPTEGELTIETSEAMGADLEDDL